MTLINHHKGIVLICKVTNFIELSHNAIHGKYTVGDNDLKAVILPVGLDQLLFKILHIIVLVTVAGSFAKPYAINNRGMVQRIRNNGIFLL